MKDLALGCVAFVVFITACRNDVGPEETRLDTIGELKAYSRDSASVGLDWLSSSSTATSYMSHHLLTVRTSSTVVQSISVPSNETGAIVQGLTEGTVYTFEIIVKTNSASPYQDSFPVSLDWSPAKRFTSEASAGQSLRLYESDSQGNFHALECYSDSLRGPRLLSLATSERAGMDFYLLSAGPSLLLRSGAIYSQIPVGRQTKFSNLLPLDAITLDHPQSFVPADQTYVLDEINVPGGTVSTGKIFFARTEDGHSVRVLIRKGPNNTLIQGPSPNRSVDIHLSYQSVPGIRFARLENVSFSPSVTVTTCNLFNLPLFIRSLR